MKSRIASGSTENYNFENYPHRLSALSDSSEREQCFFGILVGARYYYSSTWGLCQAAVMPENN